MAVNLFNQKLDLGIDWFLNKISELGGKIINKNELKHDLKQYAKYSSECSPENVIFCTSPIFFLKKYGKENPSLMEILKKHQINVFDEGYMVSVIISKNKVLVVDGFGGAKKALQRINGEFVYTSPRVYYRV